MYRMYFRGLFIWTVMTTACQAHQIGYNNGWIPLSKEQVYSRVRTGLNSDNKHDPYKYTHKPDGNVVEPKMMSDIQNKDDITQLHDIRHRAIKLVYPESGFRFSQQNVIKPTETEIIRAVNELQSNFEECNNRDCINIKSTENNADLTDIKGIKKLQEDSTDVKTRRAKAVAEDSPINNLSDRLYITENSRLRNDADEYHNTFASDEEQKDVNRLYKVTEDTIDIIPEDDVSNNKKRSGYTYAPPKSSLNYPVQNNITDKFLDILSKHNIKPEDELPNYTLSLKNKVQDTTNAFMFIPVPLRVLPQFNNLKQLSVDPLLAVLMSNYGYYFPGSYGIHSRYRNLYGHLATNNIHNNKPFGSYKIFSDTDSSN